MKFWTIQTREVVDTVMKNGFFQPDFSKSEYLAENPGLKELYEVLLYSYRRINECPELPGLIFAFSGLDRNGFPAQIAEADTFAGIMSDGKAAIESLWNHLKNRNCLILEINDKRFTNPLYIDINDFQALMPPIMILPPYTEGSLRVAEKSLRVGYYVPSVMPSGIIQSHLPNIAREDVVQIYEMFDL